MSPAAVTGKLPGMSLSIRPATAEDAATVVAMVAALCRHDGAPESELDEATFQADGFGPEAGFTALIAERDGRALGFAAYTRAYVVEWASRGCYLLQLWVEEEARDQGVGKALVAAVCQAGKAAGAEFLAWNTAVSNASAERFYRRLGGEIHDIRSWSLSGADFEALAAD